MLNPLDLFYDPVSWAFVGIYALVLLWEALFPARQLPVISGWWLRCSLSLVVFFYLSSWLPMLWDPWLAQYQLFDLSSLGTWAGAGVGILLYEAAVYAWHRTMHNSDSLWLGIHQMHHSAERIDAIGAFYFSPFDMIGWTLVGSLCLTVIVGLDPSAVTVFILTTSFFSMFQHANIRTPRWLGYLVQRPESHAIHHARDHHRQNYSDLPVFDMLFGTFENPQGYAGAAGFYDGASARVLEMLAFRDVSEPPVISEDLTAPDAGYTQT